MKLLNLLQYVIMIRIEIMIDFCLKE